MKYLLIAALVSFVFVVVYSRLRPYLMLIRKVVNSLNVAADVSATTTASRPKSPSKNKLVRCDSCGTWVPADRAVNLNAGLATFCSPECLAKKSTAKERKLAG